MFIDLWDVNYYAEKLKEQKYSYDAEEVRGGRQPTPHTRRPLRALASGGMTLDLELQVRQYLPLDGVLDGLFGVVSRTWRTTERTTLRAL